MTGPSKFDRCVVVAAALLAAAAVALALTGCDDVRGSNRPPAPGTGVGQTLVSIGLYFTWAGSFALGIGFLGVVACFVMPAIAGLRELLGDIAVIGLASLLLGSSFIWLGNNAWLLAVSVALLGAFLLYRYWPRVVRLVRKKKAQVAMKDHDHA
jgi:hypothetical protein